jgi:hypothetical protein
MEQWWSKLACRICKFLSEEDNQWTIVLNRKSRQLSKSYAEAVKTSNVTGANKVPLGDRALHSRSYQGSRRSYVISSETFGIILLVAGQCFRELNSLTPSLLSIFIRGQSIHKERRTGSFFRRSWLRRGILGIQILSHLISETKLKGPFLVKIWLSNIVKFVPAWAFVCLFVRPGLSAPIAI